MKDFQKRVIDEKQHLDKKCSALSAFIQSVAFNEVSAEEQTLLKQQMAAMDQYSYVLSQRVALWGALT